MKSVLIIVITVVILVAALYNIYKSKKSGKHCIGCPERCSSMGHCCHEEKTIENTQSDNMDLSTMNNIHA